MYGAKQLAPWFLSARALVVPRAIGLAALHGFGFNVPCITSRDRRYQTPEAAALKDGYNSLMYEDGDIEDLSAKIIQLGENDRLQRELSENARRTMDEEYTLDKMVDGFVRAIRYAHEKPHGT
jgi:glycosyltransferase involved in cell wall biosynthesis